MKPPGKIWFDVKGPSEKWSPRKILAQSLFREKPTFARTDVRGSQESAGTIIYMWTL